MMPSRKSLWRKQVGLSVKARVTSSATLVESLATYPETVQGTAELVQKKPVGSQYEIRQTQTDWGLKWQRW